MKQQVIINDAALGAWALNVGDLCEHADGTYAFEACDSAVCLHTGEVCTDEEFINQLCEYALEEGYNEQNVGVQCAALYARSLQ